MKQFDVELLSPAGGMEALKAALSAGADAVYLGSALFGARQSAGFDFNSLRDAVRLAHLFGRRVYVTVNTLVKQGELFDVRETLRSLNELHVDAVLVQDLGVLLLCLEHFPALPIHASTQMALHNAAGAAFLKTLGVRRMVLARECGAREIERVAKEGIEAEVFAHGALCVSVSGQCLFSSMIGGRSGNRGRCAQPCRLPYTYRGKTAAWLSPADLSTRDILPELLKAGARSLKIEGRLKRPEYVYIVTKAYRDALNKLNLGAFAPASPLENDALTQIFSRGSFTKGYAAEAQDAAILYPARVAPVGLPLGRVTRVYALKGAPMCGVLLSRPLHNGDGLEIDAQNIIYSGPDIPSGGIATLRLHKEAKMNALVRRTEDEAQLSAARACFEGDKLSGLFSREFDAFLTAVPQSAAELTVVCESLRVSVTGDIVSHAASRPLDEAAVRRAMQKTGGTPYHLRNVHLNGENAFLSAASLNALRRSALEALSEAFIKRHERLIPVRPIWKAEPATLKTYSRRLLAETSNPALLSALLEAGADQVLFAPLDYTESCLREALKKVPKGASLCFPPVAADETLALLKSLAEAHGLPVCLGSAGQLGLKFDVPMTTHFSVPVMNGEAERFLVSRGVQAVTLSPEMSAEDIKAMPEPLCERILLAYGRMRLMTLTHCPERVARGLSSGRASCPLCDRGEGARGQALIDRRGYAFKLSPTHFPEGCRVDVLNALPQSLLERLPAANVSLLLRFTLESDDEALDITARFRGAMDGKTPQPLPFKTTLGRYAEGIL